LQRDNNLAEKIQREWTLFYFIVSLSMFMLHFVFYIIKEYLKKRIVYFTLFGKKVSGIWWILFPHAVELNFLVLATLLARCAERRDYCNALP
jgi:hypothetical protein